MTNDSVNFNQPRAGKNIYLPIRGHLYSIMLFSICHYKLLLDLLLLKNHFIDYDSGNIH